MKKTILALLMTGTSCALFAQDDSITMRTTDSSALQSTDNSMQNNTLTSDTSYNAYSAFTATVPDYMQGYVLRDYPTAADVRWRQTGDWWHGYSVMNGQPTHLYYNNAGQTFTVSLPVRQSLVDEAVVAKAVDMFGPTLYDVNMIKGTNKQDVYHVRILENGMLSSHYIDANGNKVIDIYREDTPDATTTGVYNSSDMNSAQSANGTSTDASLTTDSSMNASSTSGDQKLKIKTENADGTQSKMKIKNGKVKTKG